MVNWMSEFDCKNCAPRVKYVMPKCEKCKTCKQMHLPFGHKIGNLRDAGILDCFEIFEEVWYYSDDLPHRLLVVELLDDSLHDTMIIQKSIPLAALPQDETYACAKYMLEQLLLSFLVCEGDNYLDMYKRHEDGDSDK